MKGRDIMSEQFNTRQGRRRARQQKKTKKGFLKKFLLFAVVLASVMSIGVIIAFLIVIQGAPSLDPDKLTLSQGAQIFDENDEFVSQLDSDEKRVNVRIQDVPQIVEDAFLSVEDIRFRQHFGIDVRRLFGAVAANITSGFGSEGASTITQQLVKNLFLDKEKKLKRKIQEQY